MAKTNLWLFFVVFILCLNASLASAQDREPVIYYKSLDGSLGQIAVDSFITVQDTMRYNSANNTKIYKVHEKNIVSFRINEDALTALPAAFTATLNTDITYTNQSGVATTISKTFVLNYDINSKYSSNISLAFDDAKRVKVKVTGITINVTNATTNINPISALLVENEIRCLHEFNFDCDVNPIKTLIYETSVISDSGDTEVSWGGKIGNDAYDVEWAFIEESAANRYKKTNGSPDPLLIFDNNATRITTSENKYSIPLLFPGKGFLYVRVRSVQYQINGSVLTSPWSSDYTAGLGKIELIDGHEEDLNWQSSVSFAEEGKNKAVVQYYDGSLRSRQTVTKDNSTNTTVVAETFYDFQGRPVIQVMPAPTLNTIIAYTKVFNGQLNNANPPVTVEYEKTLYDSLLSPADYCSTPAPVMSVKKGAGLYYGINNDDKAKSFHKFIPDAKGFAFTETKYTQDNTGRILSQGGVGDAFRIGSGHETKYYYGSVTDQDELDALFGTEVGDKSHYFKNMVQDANGQLSISYVDMHGRTIATALAGDSTAGIRKLSSNSPENVIDTLSGPGANVIKDQTLEIHSSILVTKAGNYQFKYNLDPKEFSKAPCNGTLPNPVCYDCLYDLEITITDDCNSQKLPDHMPFRYLRKNFSIGQIDTTCGNTIAGFHLDTTLNLPIGNYEITKKLSISKYGNDYYRENVFLKKNTCKTEASIAQALMAAQDHSQCEANCSTCLVNLGTWDAYWTDFKTKAGIATADTAIYRPMVQAEYNAAYLNCQTLCDTLNGEASSEYGTVYNSMLLDMTAPSGQYANPDSASKPYSIFFTAFDSNGDISKKPIYQTLTNYTDENGSPSFVYNDKTGTYVKPQELSPDQFAAAFRSTWASALLPYHPEYCHLLEFSKYAGSMLWDVKFGKVETYAEANTRGWLNPTGLNSSPHNIYGVANNDSKDPYGAVPGSHIVDLQNKMNEFATISNADQKISIWGLSSALVRCTAPTGNPTCQTNYANPNYLKAFGRDNATWCTGDLDMAWRNFREFYLNTKRDLIQQTVNTAACSTGYWATNTPPLNSDLVTLHYNLNFNSGSAAMTQEGLGIYTQNPPNLSVATDSTKSKIGQYYQSNCKAYATLWLEQLGSCPYTTAQKNEVIALLTNVCVKGSDQDHPYGSSTISPDSTNVYYSFEEVIKDYNADHVIAYNTSCNADLISAPKPYDQQPAYTAKPIYSAPSTCECDRINTFKIEYNTKLANGQTTASSFSQYLSQNYQTNINDSVLNLMQERCNSYSPSSCNYLTYPIALPPLFQCYTGTICVDCEKVNTLYNSFVITYGFIPTLPTNGDTTLEKGNRLFENYMNNRLGFNKLTWEYISFLESCDGGGNNSFGNNGPPNNQNNFAQIPSCTATSSDFEISKWYVDKDGSQVWKVNLKADSSCNSGRPVVVYIYKFNNPGYDLVGAISIYDYDYQYGAIHYGSDDGIYTMLACGTIRCPYTNPCDTSDFDAWPDFLNNSYLDSLHYSILPNKTLASCNLGQHVSVQIKIVKPDNTVTTYKTIDFVLGGQVELNVPVASVPAGSTIVACGDIPACIIPYSICNDFADIERDFKAYYAVQPPSKGNCDTAFAGFFNRRQNPVTYYTFGHIDTLYRENCGIILNVCPANSGPLLCGKAEPLATPLKLTDVNSCTDSAFFAQSGAIEIYKVYTDSLRTVFDTAYRSKCLEAWKYESFSITHVKSEYHYTLYYYDQAGNLVKTVPPAGVFPIKSGDSLALAKKRRLEGGILRPNHFYTTEYRYNTLNQVIAQFTPDAARSDFYYDRMGRLAISQNAKQALVSKYSYTKYDAIGRISEVGETSSSTAITVALVKNVTQLKNWFTNTGGGNTNRTQVTMTVYDESYLPIEPYLLARNLRNRVGWVALYSNNSSINSVNYTTATFYSYDIHGNVDTLLQDYKQGMMNSQSNRFKRLVYRYDLLSGKVNSVAYQPNERDAFYHKYYYDADNRITDVATSRDSIYWEHDAFYSYYKHGPLARVIIGQQQVQGIDYAYTLQGWLKGVNSTAMSSSYDMGTDGSTTKVNIARDAYGFALHYYDSTSGFRDYQPINDTKRPFATASVSGSGFIPLYNGNIAAMSVNIPTVGQPLLYVYSYDQLNRLRGMQADSNFNATDNKWSPVQINAYKETITYDPNGNISTYVRNGTTGLPSMDNFTYRYYYGTTAGAISTYTPPAAIPSNAGRLTNSLAYVDDAVSSTNYTDDMDDQSAYNYEYDAIGNLTKDNKEGISNIDWNVYGKINTITKTNGTTITYTYDPSGNRISKAITVIGNTTTTWYVRDASGNVISIYSKGDNSINTGLFTQSELHLYGSSRLAIYRLNLNLEQYVPNDSVYLTGLTTYAKSYTFTRGQKFFELSNHLGNVLVIVSDKKIGYRPAGSTSPTFSYYNADVITANDYYPFGSLEPSRNYNASGANDYRYGFNGKENDNDVKGIEGSQQDYGMRIYDPRTGRFLSIDPLTNKYPELTPYQFASNRPIDGIDIDGLEYISPIKTFEYQKNGFDIPKAIDNGIISVGNGLIGLWNSGVSSLESLKRGTYTKDLKADAKKVVENIKQTAVNSWNYSTKTPVTKQFTDVFTNPQNLELGVSLYAGLKIGGTKLKVETKVVTETKVVVTAEAASTVDNVALAAKYAKNRPTFWKGRVEKVWEAAKDVNGKVYDPNTFEELTWDTYQSRYNQWHMGHKPGFEYKKLIGQLRNGEITQKQFLSEYNNPNNYKPEAPAANMSHKYEAPSN